MKDAKLRDGLLMLWILILVGGMIFASTRRMQRIEAKLDQLIESKQKAVPKIPVGEPDDEPRKGVKLTPVVTEQCGESKLDQREADAMTKRLSEIRKSHGLPGYKPLSEKENPCSCAVYGSCSCDRSLSLCRCKKCHINHPDYRDVPDGGALPPDYKPGPLREDEDK